MGSANVITARTPRCGLYPNIASIPSLVDNCYQVPIFALAIFFDSNSFSHTLRTFEIHRCFPLTFILIEIKPIQQH